MRKLLLLLTVFLSSFLSAQVGIGTSTPDSDASLDVSSTTAQNKGLKLPIISLTSTTSPSPLGSHSEGMVVYNTATSGSGSAEVLPGFYYNDGTKWIPIIGDELSGTDYNVMYDLNTTPPATGSSGLTYTDEDEVVTSTLPTDAANALFLDPSGGLYTWDGTKFITFKARNSTEWYIRRTTVDAGSNKNIPIYRNGKVAIGEDRPGTYRLRISDTRDPLDKAQVQIVAPKDGTGNRPEGNFGINFFRNENGAFVGYITDDANGGNPNITNGGVAALLAGNNRDLALFTQKSSSDRGNAKFPADANNIPRLYIEKNTGHVGIGLTNPEHELHVNGNILATGQVWSLSDIRLKSNIVSLTGALSKVLKINGVNWFWKNPENHGSIDTNTGIIAQEIEAVMPELVNTLQDENNTKSVNYNGISAYLIEAIKEQQTQINTLKESIENQEEQIALLKKIIQELKK